MAGFEPATPGFSDRCSTIELHSNRVTTVPMPSAGRTRANRVRVPRAPPAASMTKIVKQKTPETWVSGVACVPNGIRHLPRRFPRQAFKIGGLAGAIDGGELRHPAAHR